jgi:hypothetical protein
MIKTAEPPRLAVSAMAVGPMSSALALAIAAAIEPRYANLDRRQVGEFMITSSCRIK